MIRSTIRTYILLTVLVQLGGAFLGATYVVFLLGRGLDLLQANLVNAAFFLAMTLCEIPTGAIADVLGRRASFLSACGLLTLSSFIYAVSETATGFIVAEVVSAIGWTCRSGAFQAWLVDQLTHHDYRGPLTPLFARSALFERGALMLGALAGPFLYRAAPQLPWIASGCTFALAGIVAAVVMREDYFARTIRSWREVVRRVRDITRNSVSFGLKSEPVRFVLLLVAGHGLAVMVPNMLWQPYFGAQLPSPLWLGPLFGAMMLAGSIGTVLSPLALRRIRCERRLLIWAEVGTGLAIAATVLAGSLALAVVAFLLHEAVRGTLGPVSDGFLNAHTPSEMRATVLSCQSIAFDAAGTVGLLASGLIVQAGSMQLNWVAAGILLAGWSLFVGRRYLAPSSA